SPLPSGEGAGQGPAGEGGLAARVNDGLNSSPQSTALHENKPPFAPTDTLTPTFKPAIDPLLSPPPRTEVASRFGPSATSPSLNDVDPRVAVSPSRLDLSSPPLPSATAPFSMSTPAA